MKKVSALVLVCVMLMSMLTLTGTAQQTQEYNEYPTILVPGYTSSYLYRIDEETGEEIAVWWDMIAQVAEGGDGASLLPDVGASLLKGKLDPLADKLAEGFARIFDAVKCNPDGTSYYDVKCYSDTAAECNYAALMEKYPEGELQYEKEIMADLAEKVGYENLYVFSADFRMGAIENAEKLRVLIDDVIANTNSNRAREGKAPIDKVNLFAVSHGGQNAGVYLSLYGHEGKVHNAVLTCPAMGGAGIAYDVFSGEVDFDITGLITFIEHATLTEEDYQLLLSWIESGLIDDFVKAMFPRVFNIIGYWGSLWDFIPLDKYEQVKELLLDEELNAGLIEKSDRLHYDIMSPDGGNYYAKGFARAQQAGTNIYVIAGYDNQIVTGMKESSDAIIPTSGATGATVAPYGQRFADGYTQKVDTGFYQVSPSMTVDASTCYLPEHTWLIENYYHGMTAKDDYSYSLMKTLLLAKDSYNVNTLEGYSQFHATTNPSHSVSAAFNTSKEGYLAQGDTSLIVTNLSKENDMIISGITVNGAKLTFRFRPFVLKAGESREVIIDSLIPELGVVNFEINITYLIETVTPLGSRTFDFTILNGEKAEYEESAGLVKADMTQKLDTVVGPDGLISTTLNKSSFKPIMDMLFDIYYGIFERIISVFDFLFD